MTHEMLRNELLTTTDTERVGELGAVLIELPAAEAAPLWDLWDEALYRADPEPEL